MPDSPPPSSPQADLSRPMRSLEQVSRLTGVSVAHLRREVRLGKLVAHRFGRLVRIAEPDLRAYLASRRRVRR